jgi:hypothetical protein
MKPSPVVNEAPRHEYAWGNGSIAPCFLNVGSRRRSASRPGRFTPGERAPVAHWIRGSGGLQGLCGRGEKEIKSLPLPGIEPWSSRL